jgi:hypothetical protein
VPRLARATARRAARRAVRRKRPRASDIRAQCHRRTRTTVRCSAKWKEGMRGYTAYASVRRRGAQITARLGRVKRRF